MPHITLTEGVPGILGPMLFRPETAKPLNELAELLLRGPNSLSRAERELIAMYVSSQNDCFFYQTIHDAVAAHHLRGNETLVAETKRAPENRFHRETTGRFHSSDCLRGRVYGTHPFD